MEVHHTSGKAHLEALTQTLLFFVQSRKNKIRNATWDKMKFQVPTLLWRTKSYPAKQSESLSNLCIAFSIWFHTINVTHIVEDQHKQFCVCVFDLIQVFCDPFWQACVLLSSELTKIFNFFHFLNTFLLLQGIAYIYTQKKSISTKHD